MITIQLKNVEKMCSKFGIIRLTVNFHKDRKSEDGLISQ